MKQPVFLRVYLNGKLENVKQFTDEQIVIGRNPDIQLQLTSDSVSPLHAIIEERDSGYYLSDLGSQLGTFRNGQKIFDEKLESGDEVTVGPFKIEFFVGVPKPKSSPAGAPIVAAPTPPVSLTPNISDIQVPREVKTPVATVPPTKVVTPPPATVVAPPPTSVVSRTKTTEEKKPEIKTPYKPMVSAKTFAPPGAVNDLAETLKTSKGATVEVVVAWGDRILGSYHFSEAQDVKIGADEKADIAIPLVGSTRQSHALLKIAGNVRVCITPEMSGDYYRDGNRNSLSELKRMNRMMQVDSGFEFELLQGEMVRIGLHGDLLNIYVRFIPESPKPLVAPIFDFSTSESAAVIMSVLVAGFFALYMLMFSPTPMPGDEDLLEEPLRRATIVFNVPKVVQVTEAPQTEKKVVEVTEKKVTQAQTTNPDSGKAASLKPSERVANKGEVASSVKQGGAVKTAPKESANMKTRDIGKTGLLSVFGSKGTQKELSQATSGSGELIGTADAATGTAGNASDRAGDSFGGRLKNVGGGKGSSTVGIGGIGTQGKGTGPAGNGTGGIGQKGRADINIEGSGAEFTGTIDKEAIRRVIRENIRQFKYCYDQALRRNSDAYGKVEIQWDIEEKGRATNIVVKSNSSGDASFGKCVGDKIKGLTFPEPPPDQVARVVYPFVFAAQ